MAVDVEGGLVEVLLGEAHSDEAGLVPKPAGVEDGADLADDVDFLHGPDPVNDLVGRKGELVADGLERLFRQRKGGLDDVEDLPVCLVDPLSHAGSLLKRGVPA